MGLASWFVGAVGRIRRRSAPKAMILRYHRVTELSSDPHAICVTPRRFAEHMEILREFYRPITLRSLVQSLRDGEVPDQAVVVTFDDGYADNLHEAKPLLERYGVPATVFLITGCLVKERELWWDELERILLQPGHLPQQLRVAIEGRSHQWELGEAARYSEREHGENAWWTWRSRYFPTQRHRIFRGVFHLLQSLHEIERDGVLATLAAWAGTDLTIRPTHRLLTPDEVMALKEGELIEIGSHTVTHPLLSKLPLALQREEIRSSKTSLEELLGHPVTSFAYPYGASSDSVETRGVVQEAGFECACTTEAAVVPRKANRLALPRFYVGNWGGNLFRKTLDQYSQSRRWS